MVRETRHLWVGNLPLTIREERILDHFKRYGKVQSVKILPKKEEDGGGVCATVAFIDIKSAAKAHNAEHKIEERALKTDYYEPPASSTATSAIYIHERDAPAIPYPPPPRTPRYGLSEERSYERTGHYYNDRETYLSRPLGMRYHDEDNYQGRAKSRDRYPRSNSGTTYPEGTDRNQNHFRSHNSRHTFDQQRYPVGEQYSDEREPAAGTPRLNRRTNNSTATPVVAPVASPTTTRSESRSRRSKRRSLSRTPSGSRSNSGSRSRSRSSSGSRSSSSSSKLRSTSSDSSGQSRSPSKSRSPAASFGSQSNAKSSRLDRPLSAIANPSSSVCYLPSTVNTSAINCTSNSTQGSIPAQGCLPDSLQNSSDKEDKRPLGICVRNLPVRSTDTSLKDGLFHEYKKHGKVTMVKVIGQGTDRYAVVCFKKPEDVEKALEVSKDKLFFGCKIEVTAHEGLDAEDNEFRPLEAELDEYHPKATRTLFIGNLEKDITTAELRKHFEQFGEIIEIDIKKQGTGTSYAFIQYSDIASVVKAMRKLDGENLGANRIKLGFGKSMPTNCVWLDGIVDCVSDKFLARHFSRYGIVAYTAVDREKGHALVFFESVEFAQIAVSDMRGRILQGKKLQVDFASRECQTTFFDKLEMTGQLVPEDGSRPWERRDRRGPEFEVVRPDDREARVGFENRAYQRYEAQSRTNRGNFRGSQRATFPGGRGRGQTFSGRYEGYHDEFGERRHRYSRDDSLSDVTLFDKNERLKYSESLECPGRKRNKHRSSISDQESHHSQSPPHSRHQSRSTSPVSKERKSLKDRLHHRIKSPGSHNSSLVSSPCRDALLDELDANCEYRDSRSKNCEVKLDDLITELSYSSPRSSSEKEGFEKMVSKSECDSFRSRSSLDAESADESGTNCDQLERKKRLLASSGKSVSSKLGCDKLKPKNNSIKTPKLSEATIEELKSELESVNLQYECAKEKSLNSDCANAEMKYLKKKQVQIMHLLEQLQEGVNSSDNDCSIDGDRLSRKKHRSSSCIESNSVCENDISQCHTKDECRGKLCKSSVKDSTVLAKLKKPDTVDNNCVSLSLDSFIFRKHADPRKGFDQHSIASLNSLPNSRRVSADNDVCLPNSHSTSEPFLCAPPTEGPWKKHTSSVHDANLSENEAEGSMTVSHFKMKEEGLEDEVSIKKSHLSNSHSPKMLLSLRSYDGHEVKKERDGPLSLPLPKFAASLRSPKSSPSTLTSPRSSSAHSHSPVYSSSKSVRIPDLLHDIPSEKKPKELIPEDKMNGANTSPTESSSLFEPPITDTSESVPSVEPIQSPRSSFEKIKESLSSSESEFSPSASPNCPSIEDRIKALDEIMSGQSVRSGSARTPTSAAVPEVAPSVTPDLTPKTTIKRRFSYLSEPRKEPSDIVKSLLARSTIFDQDSKRLQHIDEKYEPLSVKMELNNPKTKQPLRTKAAAKEFSSAIAPALPTLSPTLVKNPTVVVAQGIISPPATPQSASCAVLSSVPHQVSTPIPASIFTPTSPRTSFSLPSGILKAESLSSPLDRDLNDTFLKSSHVFNSVKAKVDLDYHVNSAALATSLKSSPLTIPTETPTHGSVVTSLPIKKEPSSPTEAVMDNVCNTEVDCKTLIKKELNNSICVPIKKESTILAITPNHSHFNSLGHSKRDFCDSRDPRLAFSEGVGRWRENGCKEEAKVAVESCAKSYPCTDVSETASIPAGKKRVLSVESIESDSCKSIHPEEIVRKLSHDPSREEHESSWIKQEKTSEPEPKKPKLCKSTKERSVSPPVHSLSKKSEKREKSSKPEKVKSSSSKPASNTSSEKVQYDLKSSSKSDQKEKERSKDRERDRERFKSEHKNSKEERTNVKEEKYSKCKESKDSRDSGSKCDSRSKPRERRNSEKEKSSSSSSKSNKIKKETPPHKAEKSSEKKQKPEKKSSIFDLEQEPVFFSMYDKVKQRSSKLQSMKHQTPNDLESVRQKFSKLKQRRAKKEKSKSVDQDSDKDSDSSHHSSESESKAKLTKSKQQRKRKLVIETSSEEEAPPPESSKPEKHYQSDSAEDSDFDYNVSHRQAANKSKKKKPDLLNSDSSDSDSNPPSKSQSGKKKFTGVRSKGRLEKSKKMIQSEDDASDLEIPKTQKSKEKERSKKVKKEKSEVELMDCDISKRSEESKNSKKKLKEARSETDLSPTVKKFKPEHSSKEKLVFSKEKRTDNSFEKVHSSEETEKHKTYSKKRKKSKKVSRSKEKRSSDKNCQDSRKHSEDNDAKSSLPVLLSPKQSSPLHDKQLSPPHLQAGVISDNDYKSEFSDFDFEHRTNEDLEASRDMWKHLESKADSHSEKSSRSKKENFAKSEIRHSPEQDLSLPSFFDKLSDVTDSEMGKDASDISHEVPPESAKLSFSSKKEKEFSHSAQHKNKHEKHEDQSATKHDSSKYSDSYSFSLKEERRKKKSKKQSKEKKKKFKDEGHVSKEEPLLSPKHPAFGGDDSRISDIQLEEDIRALKSDLLAVSEETSTFGDVKKEEKLQERRFEEEAAKETRRLEAELLSTGRDSWHMKENDFDSEPNSGDLCDDNLSSNNNPLAVEDKIFGGLEIHSSVGDSSQNDNGAFLAGQSENDPYKIDEDKDVNNEIEDQRKMEDDLAVSALLQEMHCGEMSAPDLTKESDYLEMETHREETVNYLLPDDGENSLHIADSSPENHARESPEPKLESDVLSPSSNSEPPPALEISTVEDSSLMKMESNHTGLDSLKLNRNTSLVPDNESHGYDYPNKSSIEVCDRNPPIINLPGIHRIDAADNPVSINANLSNMLRKKQMEKAFRIPSKPDMAHGHEGNAGHCSSELAKNQLTSFEDITNDTADSKDDDNPPILLPVESPPNLLPAADAKDQMEPLVKAPFDDNECLDRIISSTPSSAEGGLDILDKQIGDIINSITANKKQAFNSDGPNTNISGLPEHNMSHTLAISSTPSIFVNANNNHLASENFNIAEIVKRPEKEMPNSNQSNLIINNAAESSRINLPHASSNYAVESSILRYPEMLNSNAEATSVIQSCSKMDTQAVTISIAENSHVPNSNSFQDNRNISVADSNNLASNHFLLELFGPKTSDVFKIEPSVPESTNKSSIDKITHPEPEPKKPEPELPPINFSIQQEIKKPLFEIPEINEQNEATEFNQEIFDQSKDSHVPQLLSFSSENIFPDNSKKIEKASHDSEESNKTEKPEDNVAKDDPENGGEISAEYKKDLDIPDRLDHEKLKEDVILSVDEKLKEDFMTEESKTVPADSESVCSDTTDITISEAKSEVENYQVTSSEEQVPEDAKKGGADSKCKAERPRRGRRPKTRKSQASNPPVSMRITRRGAGKPATERKRRLLRSDALDNDKPLEEIILSEPDDSKKDNADTNEAEISNLMIEMESKSPEKPAKVDEPRKRRGRRKKSSGDSTSQSCKSDEPELPKSCTKTKDTRLLHSLSEKVQKTNKESAAYDVFEFREEEEENLNLERFHETSRTSSSFADPKSESKMAHDSTEVKEELKSPIEERSTSKVKAGSRVFSFETKHEKSFEPMEERDQVPEEVKTEDRFSGKKSFGIKHDVPEKKDHRLGGMKSVQDSRHDRTVDAHDKKDDQKAAFEERPSGRGKSLSRSSANDNFDRKDKITDDTKTCSEPIIGKNKLSTHEDYKLTSKENHSEGQHPKISIRIRLPHNGTPVIETSDAPNVEELKTDQNASKHEIVENSHSTSCKSTRKSPRLMNQAATKQGYNDGDSGRGNAKGNHSNAPETRARKSRSRRRSEESLHVQSKSSEDAVEDKNKNEAVFYIPDNAVIEPTESEKNSCSSSELAPMTEPSSASESNKNEIVNRLRMFRKIPSANKGDLPSSSCMGETEDLKKKEQSFSLTAGERFDALQKEHKETKEFQKDSHSVVENVGGAHQPLPVVELSRIKVPCQEMSETALKVEKSNEPDEDSNSSNPAGYLDHATGQFTPVSKSAEIMAPATQFKGKPASDSSVVLAIQPQDSKIQLSESAPPTTSVIQSNYKVGQDDSSFSKSLRSRQITTTSQSGAAFQGAPKQLPYVIGDKPVEQPLKPIKKSSAVVPVLTSTTCPAPPVEPSVAPVKVQASQNQPAAIASVPLPAVVQHPAVGEPRKEEYTFPAPPKPSHQIYTQPLIQGVVTAVVTQTTASRSSTSPSSHPSKILPPVATTSVLMSSEGSSVCTNSPAPPSDLSSTPKPIPLVHPVKENAVPYPSPQHHKLPVNNRMPETHPQAASNLGLSSKIDGRSSKSPSLNKGNLPYHQHQQSAFSFSNFDAMLPNAQISEMIPGSIVRPNAADRAVRVSPATTPSQSSRTLMVSPFHISEQQLAIQRYVYSMNQIAEAQICAANLRNATPYYTPTISPLNNFRHQADPKADPKLMSELSKLSRDNRVPDVKLHLVKSGRAKKEDRDSKGQGLQMHMDREDHNSRKIASTSAINQQHLRQPQLSVHATSVPQVSPHPDQRTDSPIVQTVYTSGPSYGLLGDDRKAESLNLTSSQLYSVAGPPAAHQPQTQPFLSRQQMLGLPMGSPAPDGRSAHSPSAYNFKKEGLPPKIHNPVPENRMNTDLQKSISHQGSQPHNWPISHQGFAPPPAHAPSPSPNLHRSIPQSPPDDLNAVIAQFSLIWQGLLALKNDQASVQMYFLSGNLNIAQASLPPMLNQQPATSPVRISQRMRLDPAQLEGVSRKIQCEKEHCILMAIPRGEDPVDAVQQSEYLKTGFISYLESKNAAGIVNAPEPGSNQPAYVIHIFPPCKFINNLSETTSKLLHSLQRDSIAHLVVIIATV